MASKTERARAALNAMKSLGFSKKVATPVLKNLLSLYGNKWELIEDENYRVLADAILDMQENGAQDKMVDDDMDGKKKEVAVDDEQEPLRTRVRIRQEDQDPSPSMCSPDLPDETPLKRPKLEPGEEHIQHREAEVHSPRRALRGKSIEPPQPWQEEQAIMQMSPQPSHTSGRTGTVSPETSRRETRALARARQASLQAQTTSLVVSGGEKDLGNGKLVNAICLKEPKAEPGIEIRQMIDASGSHTGSVRTVLEPLNRDFPNDEAPLAFICPPHSTPSRSRDDQGQGIQDDSPRNIPTLPTNVTKTTIDQHGNSEGGEEFPITSCQTRNKAELVNVQEPSSTNVDIASSANGEVKISLTCNTGRSNFQMPSLEAVYRMVEDRCLRSYRILQPDFSLGNLMNEICQCVLDLSNETTTNNQENSVKVDSAVDYLIRSGVHNITGSMGMTPSGVSNIADPKCSGTLANNDGNGGNQRGKNTKEPPLIGASENRPEGAIVVQPHHLALGDVRPNHDVNDISKGEERLRISVVNEVNSEKYPSSFNYIPQNLIYQNAYVNFSLARIGDEDCCSDCFGDCLSAPIPCACARETGGEYAYTPDGVVKMEFLEECISMNRDPQNHHHIYCKDCPLERSKNEATPESCKGHLVRRFIKECWSKCGCNKQCGNRVVQRGITCNLQVFFTSEGKGWGLQTLDELPRGAFVCEYVGEVLTNMELYYRTVQSTGNAKHTYPVLLDADWGSEGVLKDEEALCLDATFYGNVARFVNHRCYDANLVEIPVEVETPDHHYYHLAFFTTRKVEAFEELTWDYGIDFDDHDHPIKAFRCRCGSRYCRDLKRTNSRRKALVLK
ncbi:probable inactive histone-lysine N-methyltransferase SUVR2 isoform X2 [Typha angustifolia]|uniref:probable inactive histone-lysine N-methyltransferase SUVR2 isoform X2 n=1 Tax=Typha angustifolia TaxID=59011 RepID=UPI003C30C0D6